MKKIIYLLFALWFASTNAYAQLPLTEGDLVITHSPSKGNCTSPGIVVRTVKAANTATAPALGTANWNTPMMPPAGTKQPNFNYSNWNVNTLGTVFGITLDDNTNPNIYVSSTQIYNGGTTYPRKVWRLNGTTGANTLVYNFGNSAKSLGNIKYKRIGSTENLYVSDWQSKTIKRLIGTSTGTALWSNPSSYTPTFPGGATIPNTDSNMVYGLAVRKLGTSYRLYYARISTYTNNSSGSFGNNEIYSVGLDAVGDFVIGSETKENLPNINQASSSWGGYPSSCITNGNYVSNPYTLPVISDIAFSSDGKRMLVAQQTWGTFGILAPHNSGVYEFVEPVSLSTNWVSSTHLFGVGVYNSGLNSVGGISYSNNILQEDSLSKYCDTTVWATADYINVTGSVYVYGLQGYKSSGGTVANTLWIDADDDLSYYDKNFLGDVEAYKKDISCVQLPCNCGHWVGDLTFNGQGTATDSATGFPTITTTSGNVYGLINDSYMCNGGGCGANYNWQITNNANTVVVTGASLPIDLSQYNNVFTCGNYTLTLYAHCGANTCDSIKVNIKTILGLSVHSTNVTCSGSGTAMVTAMGGISPYTYLWNNGATTANVTNLTAGTYSITVTDVNGCTNTTTMLIGTNVSLVNFNISNTPYTCSIGGTATIITTSGLSPFTYLWSNGATTQTITNLAAGTYSVTVTDSNGCKKIDSVIISNECVTTPPCNCNQAFHFSGNPVAQMGTLQNNQFTPIGNPITEPCSPNAGSLQCNRAYQFYINFTNPYTAPCKGYDSAVIVKNGITLVASNANCSNINSLYYTFTSNGNYCIKHYLKVNGIVCDSCITCFNVTCPINCNCTNVDFNTNPTVSWGITKKGGGYYGYSLSTPCNTSMSNKLNCGTPYSFGIGVNVTGGCAYTLTTEIATSAIHSAIVATQTNTSTTTPLNYTFTNGGTYCVTFKLYVAGVLCKTCSMCFEVCCNNYVLPNISGTLVSCTIGSTNYLKADSVGGIWESIDTGVAKVNSYNGGVTALANGNASIIYSLINKGCRYYTATDYTVASVSVPSAITGASSVCVGSSTVLSNVTQIPTGSSGVWSTPSSSLISINPATGVAVGKYQGTASIQYKITNSSGCSNAVNYSIIVKPIPNVPTVQYAAGTVNPQTGPNGTFCANKTFTVVGNPAAGVWSSTGVITVGGSTGIVSTGPIAGTGSLTYTININGCLNSKVVTGINVAICPSHKGVASNEIKSSSKDFTMYPNPATSIVNLYIDKLFGAGSIIVTDLYGKQVKIQALSKGTNSVDISSLSKGFYFVSVITNDGKATKKLIVE